MLPVARNKCRMREGPCGPSCAVLRASPTLAPASRASRYAVRLASLIGNVADALERLLPGLMDFVMNLGLVAFKLG